MGSLQALRDQYVQITGQTVDYERFNHYALIHHSNAIEGSTLTKLDNQILLEKGITPGGKKMEEIHMALDHFKALKFTLKLAEDKNPLRVADIQKIAGLVVQNTKGIMNTALGSFDASKGDFRLVNVHVGTTSFVNFKKVPELVQKFCDFLNNQITQANNYKAINELAFKAHYQLVSIHPFLDGNGRTSRLIQNYVQHYHKEPITPTLNEDRKGYLAALQESRKVKKLAPFIKFMNGQQEKFFKVELDILKRNPTFIKDKNTGVHFIF